MQYRIVKTALITAMAFVFATLSIAAENKSSASPEPGQKTTPPHTTAKSKANASTQATLVDINTANRTELKRLAGIGDAEADRIIAGRPYLSKADLVTRGIVSPGVYESLKKRVIAKPKPL